MRLAKGDSGLISELADQRPLLEIDGAPKMGDETNDGSAVMLPSALPKSLA